MVCMSIDLGELRQELHDARNAKYIAESLARMFAVMDRIIGYLEEQESYRQEMKEGE